MNDADSSRVRFRDAQASYRFLPLPLPLPLLLPLPHCLSVTLAFLAQNAVWDKFIRNSQSCYKLGANVTIDKQLFPSKARFRFIQCLPNKADKF
ncbi:unnamed protein product, partial [Heterotrigona itama]